MKNLLTSLRTALRARGNPNRGRPVISVAESRESFERRVEERKKEMGTKWRGAPIYDGKTWEKL